MGLDWTLVRALATLMQSREVILPTYLQALTALATSAVGDAGGGTWTALLTDRASSRRRAFPTGLEVLRDVADNSQPLMIIRHAEKPTSGNSHGVTPDGGHDHDSLTVWGWVRAGALIELFGSATRAPQVGLGSPERIYAAGCRGGESKRAIQTVTPLADHLGIEVDTHYQQGDEAHLAKEIRELRCTTLVCWHHENIHKIVEHLGPVTPEPPHSWPDDRFDLVWTFTNTADGWWFAQVPQLIMPEDRPDPITEAASEVRSGRERPA